MEKRCGRGVPVSRRCEVAHCLGFGEGGPTLIITPFAEEYFAGLKSIKFNEVYRGERCVRVFHLCGFYK